MAQQTALSVTATPGRVHSFSPKGAVDAPACANIVITRANTASIGLLAANVATPLITLANTSIISLAALNGASMAITRANTATISITECN